MKKVGEVSRLTGLSKRALQYYDDEGLVLASRSKQNYRLYDDDELDRIWEILILRELGQDLNTIRKMIGRADLSLPVDQAVLKGPLLMRIESLDETIRLIDYAVCTGLPPRPSEAELGNRTYLEWIAAWRRRALNERRDQG
ncbi:MAG: MerR family transcriptional regulator [Anaerovoracaceae bacterium]|jgi:DNA-binding transcriptional MerR regulator